MPQNIDTVPLSDLISRLIADMDDMRGAMRKMQEGSETRRRDIHHLRNDLQTLSTSFALHLQKETAFAKDVAALQEQIGQIGSDTAEIVGLFKDAQGGIKTVARFARFAKWIASLVVALGAAWAAIKGWKP